MSKDKGSILSKILPPAPEPGETIVVKPKLKENGDAQFSGLTAVLYVIMVALDVEDAEAIAETFSDRLGTRTITTPIDASYLAQIVRDARA